MKVHSVIICDLIRREDSGKGIIIGVYSDDILVSKFPADLRLSFWVQLSFQKVGTYQIEMRSKIDGVPVIEISGDTKIEKVSGLATIATPPLPIKMDGDCMLTFELRESGKRWKSLRALPVRLKREPSQALSPV